jgi:hypothetical protein
MTEFDVEFDPALREPPLLAFVRDYWHSQRGAARMPRRADIAPSDMKTHLPNILLADVVDKGRDFRYRVVGSQLQRYFDGNPTGMLMSSALAIFGPDAAERTIRVYQMVLERRTPLRVCGSGSIYSQQAKFFDALLTPLSDDGETVNMILGTFVFEWQFDVSAARITIVEPDEAALSRALQLTH